MLFYQSRDAQHLEADSLEQATLTHNYIQLELADRAV